MAFRLPEISVLHMAKSAEIATWREILQKYAKQIIYMQSQKLKGTNEAADEQSPETRPHTSIGVKNVKTVMVKLDAEIQANVSPEKSLPEKNKNQGYILERKQ